MINIIMIAYEFPPVNSGGSHRPYKFSRHLEKFGIHPIIITPEPQYHQGRRLDESIKLSDLSATIVRTAVDPSKAKDKSYDNYYFNIVDVAAKRWKRHCIAAVAKVIQDIKIQAVYVTVPPFSMAGLGRLISKQFDLPLIFDMRDAWSNWVVSPYASYFHYLLTKRAEQKALRAASAIVTVSDQMVADLQELHPQIPKERFHLITNAYDEVQPQYPSTLTLHKPTEQAPLKIGYVGSFYYSPYQRDLVFQPWWKKKPHQFFQYTPRKEDWRYRSPYFFFKILAALFDKTPAAKKLIKVEFVGNIADWMLPMIQQFGLEEVVQLLGRLPHKKALEFQDDCDALLLTSVKVLDGFDYCIAGKSFEYICRKKPILAVVTAGSQKRFIEKTGLGVVCDADDLEGAVLKLEQLLDGNIILKPNENFIHKSHIKYTTEQLANIIKKLKE